MRRVILWTSIASVLALFLAQLAAVVDVMVTPAPALDRPGPQGRLDLGLGLVAGPGGVLGAALAVVAGITGLVEAIRLRAIAWAVAICTAGALAGSLLFAAAFILLGLPNRAFHPLVLFSVVPLTGGAFALRAPRQRPGNYAG